MHNKKFEITPADLVIFNQICTSKKILLTFHYLPDPDSVGSNLGLAYFLKSLGNDVTVLYGPTGKTSDFDYIVKDFPVSEAFLTEINPADYDAFVIIDIARPNRAGLDSMEQLVLWNEKIIIIDHHVGNNWHELNQNISFKSIIKGAASSSAEVLARLIFAYQQEERFMIAEPVAKMLKIGIWSDTNGLTLSTTSATISCFERLSQISDSSELIQRHEKPLTIADAPVFAYMMENFQIISWKGSNIGIVEMPSTVENIPSTHLGMLLFNKFHDIDVVCVFVQQSFDVENPCFRLSVRSDESKASGVALKIAQAVGGSGHANAAGAMVPAQSSLIIVNKIKDAIKNIV